MPTLEQIKSLIKIKSKKYKNLQWLNLSKEWRDAIFCTKCQIKADELLGGFVIYWPSTRSELIRMRMEIIIDLIKNDKTEKEIAAELGISESLLKYYLKRMLEKRKKHK